MTVSGRRPSTVAWMIVHLLFPLLPFILEGVIRWIVNQRLAFETFSASTLSMSAGLMAIFVNQHLKTYNAPLTDAEEEDSVVATAMWFLGLAIVFFALFGLLVAFGALVNDRKMDALLPVLRAFQFSAFAGVAVPIVTAIAAQRSFKLRASFT